MTTSPRAPGSITVGPYRLVARLGEGGMGVVHLGETADGSRHAVKVLRPHVVGDEEARQRLEREVSSLGRVRSPRVAEIVDADPWGPIPYVATRYVPGLSLADHVREEGPLQPADLRWFARALAEALTDVHAAGVLHRDIKPSNVLLEGRTPVLIDFGLARVADDARLTRTGWLLGTPGYIAPEVLRGEEPGLPADVHGWATTVAFAGLGRPPFGHGPSMAIMDRVRRGDHDLGDLDPSLRDLLTRALDPEPARRPTLPEALAGLGGPGSDDDPRTVPLAAAYAVGLAAADATTAHGPAEPDGSTGTMAVSRTPYRTPPPADWAPPRTTLAERARRWLLGLGGIVAVAAATGVAPYPTLTVAALAVVVLRSWSLTTSRAGARQQLRGRKWYDAVLTPLSVPWYLLGSVPTTALLLLWAGIGAAVVALLGVALGLADTVVLWSAGAVIAVLLWTGPGAARVRAPVRRGALPLAREATPTLGTLAALVVVSAALWWLTGERGPDWSPADGPPWRHLPGLG